MSISSLKALLEPWITLDKDYDRPIVNLSADSRCIQQGDVFFALQGMQQHGRLFIDDAINQGAVAILCEDNVHSEILNISPEQQVSFICLPQLAQKMGLIAARFFDHPSQHLKVIGVTGTNGKTSCTQWIASALNDAGQLSGVIGTLGSSIPSATSISSQIFQNHTHVNSSEIYTTPGPIQLQRTLANFLAQKTSTVCMEVSSHGLDQHRVDGVHFDLAVFTNLSQDHLDYHGDLNNYALAKKRLFDWPNLKKRIFNCDDAYGQQWFTEYAKNHGKNDEICIGYSLQPDSHQKISKEQLVTASSMKFSQQGITATIHSPWGEGELQTTLMGRFNLSNLLAVLSSLCLQNVSFAKAMACLSLLKSPPGRVEVLGENEGPKIVIDYAHTPDALEQVLKSLGEHCVGNLWCVFGCGGDRDKTKRPIMGKIAEKYADFVIVTDDNPRHEKPAAIIKDILSGLALDSAATIEHDRRKAIKQAVSCAKTGDIVLIAGKGHECYQQIGDEKFPFNDRVEVLLALNMNET